MCLSDFRFKMRGFFAKRKSDEMNFANLAFIIDGNMIALSGGKANYKTFIKGWFGEKEDPKDKEKLREDREEIRRRLKLTNQILEEKEKNAGTAKNSNRRRRK